MPLDKETAGKIVANLFATSAVPDPSLYAANEVPSSTAPHRQADTEVLKTEIERLLIISEALWTMLKDQYEYTDAHLVERITEIDARDGKVDGRVSKGAPPACPSCQRPVSRKMPVCLYCGTKLPVQPFAR